MRGTAQNPDVFFQAREACNPYHLAVPGIVQEVMDELAGRTGRHYRLVDYHGSPDAERVIVAMGSATGAIEETVDALVAAGEKVGLLRIRLFQPFPAEQIVAALPSTVRAIAVLDRTKEPGAVGEPLYLEIVASLAEAMDARRTAVRDGAARDRRPLRAVVQGDDAVDGQADLRRAGGAAAEAPLHGRHLRRRDPPQPAHRPEFRTPRPAGEVQAMFFGLGSDGTVGANKASVKIIGESADLFAQGYFVYDSKKSGSITVSHLRFGPEPIRSTYLIENADFVACHQFGLLGKMKVLEYAKPGATFLLNSPYGPDEVWEHLPGGVQRMHPRQGHRLLGHRRARCRRRGRDGQPDQHRHAAVLLQAGRDPAAGRGDRADQGLGRPKTYAKRGEAIVDRNFAAIDRSLERLGHVTPRRASPTNARRPRPSRSTCRTSWPASRPALMAGDGDLLPVSALPVDGTFPTGTTKYEKRAIAQMIPIWDPAICIDCGKCAIVCPHATIRMKVFPTSAVADAPPDFLHKEFRSRELADHRLTIQVAPDDCTGCGVCVDVCPARSKTDTSHKAIDMAPVAEHRDVERTGAGTSSSRSRGSTGTRSPTTPSRAARSSSRCSSSRGPAVAAARRRTSGW